MASHGWQTNQLQSRWHIGHIRPERIDVARIGDRLVRCLGLAAIAMAIFCGINTSVIGQTSTATPAEPARTVDSSTSTDDPIVLDLHVPSPVAVLQQRYRNDRGNLSRFYNIESSPTRWNRLRTYDVHWLVRTRQWHKENQFQGRNAELEQLIAEIEKQLQADNAQQKQIIALAKLQPFASEIIELCEARQRVDPIDAANLALRVNNLADVIANSTQALDQIKTGEYGSNQLALAKDIVQQLKRHMAEWQAFYNEYDPIFTWWLAEPYQRLDVEFGRHLETFQTITDRLSRETNDDVAPQSFAAPASIDLVESLISDTNLSNGTLAEIDQIMSVAIQLSNSKMKSVIEQYGRLSRPGRRGNRGRQGGGGENDSTDQTATIEDRQRNRIANLERWEQALAALDYQQFNFTEQIDYHLLRHRIKSDRRRAEYQLKHPEFELPPVTDSSGISGQPIGNDRLLIELEAEMIPYSPDELVKLAEQEYAWCQREIKQAARELGFGDDWQAAVEKVKTLHVAPGEQPGLIRDLAHEAIDYLQTNQLVSVPEIARETWRMRMMSPERQLVSPFFLGGEVILVSFPTLAMRHADKLQSLRGNNIHFARATVHHELIPGHHLQGYMNARHRTYRQQFQTPFWLEGWALYWEFRLYDRGFPQTPEDRIGFLVWRSHRCARIIFSLNFHLGRMRPQECIDLLVARVGFEPNNAAAEVRRSLGTDYGPLYQAAYMLGGVQFRSLHKEFVGSGKMTEQAFHDRILHEHAMPVAMVRAMLQGQPIEPSGPQPWRFYDEAINAD